MTRFTYDFKGRAACYLYYRKLGVLREQQKQRMLKNTPVGIFTDKQLEAWKLEIDRLSWDLAQKELHSYHFSSWERLLGYIHVLKGDIRRRLRQHFLKE